MAHLDFPHKVISSLLDSTKNWEYLSSKVFPIGGDHIADDAIGPNHLQPDSVGASELQVDSVGASELQLDSVGASELADNSVDVNALQNASVTGDKLSTGAKNLFPQLILGVETKFNFGSTSITGSGATSANTTINHGLGKVPSFIVGIATSSFLNAAVSGFTSTQFTGTLRHINASGWSSTETFYWLAVG